MQRTVVESPGLVAQTVSVNPAIELSEVRKSYGSLKVLDRLTLQVNQGDVYGFLGRNGAGKSTTIRLLMGISQIDQGSIKLFGTKAGHNNPRLRQQVGYVAQEQHFYPWMTPVVLGDFVAGFYPRWDKRRYDTLLTRFELPAKRKIGTFSGGMKAKLALSVALSTEPTLLVLDEPTAGMDPVARREFLDLVQEQTADRAATVFFSTHLIDDIESIANRIGIVEAGKAIYEGPLSTLRESVISYARDQRVLDAAVWPVDPSQCHFHILEDRMRGDQRLVVLRIADGMPVDIPTQIGWLRQSISLEDAFISMVAGVHATVPIRG